uniref:Cystatin domain-containing protein n=1 Tax=Pseudo-nitzschia multistriata TaxID=183589 RepID=A0A448YZW8_9STRA
MPASNALVFEYFERDPSFVPTQEFHGNTTTMPGGHTASNKDVPPHLNDVADAVRPQLEEMRGERPGFRFDAYKVLEFRQQVVAGMVYHFKIRVGERDDDCLHAKVFEPLPHTGDGPVVVVQERATLQDPLKIL